ncbi:MAG: hypothetical protein RL693_722 [Verrucomicrobiota bacterium]
MHVGDLIWWNEGACVGHVQEIVDSQSECESWGFNEPHAGFANHHPYDPSIQAAVFYPEGVLEDEGVALLTVDDIRTLREALTQAVSLSASNFTGHPYRITTETKDCVMRNWVFTFFDGDKVVDTIRIHSA